MYRLLIYLIVAAILGVIFGFMQWPFWILAILFALIAIIQVTYSVYTYYFSDNLIKIEAYLKRNKKNPLFQYILLLKYGSKDEQLNAIDGVLKKYNHSNTQATYRMLHAILTEDYQLARSEAKKINNTSLQQYSLAFVAAHEGKQPEAANYELAQSWMGPSIEAVIAFQEQNFNDFKRAKATSVKKASGIQKFINAWYFRIFENTK